MTEAGMFAIRDERFGLVFFLVLLITKCYEILIREYICQEDLTKAARKVGEAKKHEGPSRMTSFSTIAQCLIYTPAAKIEYTA